MAAGDRTPIAPTYEAFEQLNIQVNDASTGLATKVDQLETSPIYTTIEEHKIEFDYPAGYPIKRGGRLEISNKATLGVYNSDDWDVYTRANGDPVVIEDGSNVAITDFSGGIYTLQITDGVDTKQFRYSLSSGRTSMPNAATIAESGDNDAALIKEVIANSDRFTWDNAEKRMTQVDEPTDVASADSDVLTKKDGDALYVSQNRPYYTASIDTTVDDGETIPVSGTNVVSNVNEMTINGTDNTITVPSDGVYSVGVVGPIVSGSIANNTAFTIDILVNSALTGGFRLREYTNDRLSYQHVGCDVLLPLSAGDNISFKVEGASLFGSANKYTRIKCIYECAK